MTTLQKTRLRALRRFLPAAALALLLAPPPFLTAETLTVPAVASLPVGSAGSPFFSDVRVFNTSYTSTVSVTAVYRCFLLACPSIAPQRAFTLGPRESRAFDDMIVAEFTAPTSAGAVEFTSSGDLVRVTSRLYSPAAVGGTNGMFVPGVKASAAHAVSVVTGLSNGLFRTNVGIYNGNDVGASATVKLFNGQVLLGMETVTLGPRSGIQLNGIFGRMGQGGLITTNAHAVVESGNSAAPLFIYGAVIDNATSDSSFVSGEEDLPAPPGPVATATPPPPASTATPLPTPTPTQPPSATVVNLTAQQFRWSFNGGVSVFTMQVGQTYEVRMRSLDVTHGFPGIPELGMEQRALGPGEIVQVVRPTAGQVGTYVFACDIECGSGHGFQGSIQVLP